MEFAAMKPRAQLGGMAGGWLGHGLAWLAVALALCCAASLAQAGEASQLKLKAVAGEKPATSGKTKAKAKSHKIKSTEDIDRLVRQHWQLPPAPAGRSSPARGTRPATADAGSLPAVLVTQDEVARLLAELARQGWRVPEAQVLLEQTLPAESFLARQLSSADGQRFLKKYGKQEGIFDRLDRLSQIPDGRKNIATLLAGPAGYHEMLAYMASGKGGQQLWTIVPEARDFQQPTGRVYSVEQLLKVLQGSFQRSQARSGDSFGP